MEQTTTSAEGAKKRPVLLTVICILNYIYVGIGLIAYIFGMLAIGAVSAMGEGFGEMGATMSEGNEEAMQAIEQGMSELESTTGMIYLWFILGIVLLSAAIIGVVKVWKMQKKGVMIYGAATILSFIVGIMINNGDVSSMFAGIGTIILTLIPFVFLAIYTMSIKNMS